MSLELWLPGESISLNNVYFNRRGGRGRVLTPEGQAFKQHVAYHVGRARPNVPPGPLALTAHLYGRWSTKNGDPRRRDLSNAIKVLEDAVFDALQLDDCRVRALNARAIHDPNPRMYVRLEAL
ncbi:RusA family crossover junction endodeoxyribonuclease [Deinococcus apachensis]|uniref:RusA family crossover junction endodeoxyribonuclease n=1 Tax=Deinococcus apachensis TaxID=309886 RepID=UPI00037357EE|nr:RusA family crossover junction endodeoxyribonuclease [Deinococcus apachensis]